MSWFTEGMKRPELMVTPLFYDLLSGEFKPLSDADGRTHTLGRLSFAAYQKGDISDVEDHEREAIQPGGSLEAYRYSPSWAPNVEATAITRTESPSRHTTRFMTAIALRDEQNGHSEVIAADVQGLTATIPGVAEPVSLELGADLVSHQELVAQFAQEFFDRAA